MFCLIIGMELTIGNVNDVPRKMDHNICGWHSSSNFGFRMLNFTSFTSKGVPFCNMLKGKIQGVHSFYKLLLFLFHLLSLTLFLLLCFIVGEEVADYDTLQ